MVNVSALSAGWVDAQDDDAMHIAAVMTPSQRVTFPMPAT